MKHFGLFTYKGNEILGSDALVRFDNRKNLTNKLIDAQIQADKEKHVQKIDGINVYIGEKIRDGKYIGNYKLKNNQR